MDDVIGLSISTRPDCLPDDVVEYLAELNKKTNLWVELGLQTIHDKTAKLINRGHNYKTFLEGVEKLKKHNIKTVVHIINGLPGEDYNMMMETAKAVADLNVDGIKIHLLHVLKNTPMENMLNKNMLELMEMDDYINLVCDQLEILPPEMIVHRLTGDGKREDMVGPMWSLKKWEVLNAIDDTMKNRNSYQGAKYNK
jgi:radical SAM protein (TIGR01212 family)